MAEYSTARVAAGARSAEIDQGLRAHMNKVYGTMSVGMLITFAAAWALSGLSVTQYRTMPKPNIVQPITPPRWALASAAAFWACCTLR